MGYRSKGNRQESRVNNSFSLVSLIPPAPCHSPANASSMLINDSHLVDLGRKIPQQIFVLQITF